MNIDILTRAVAQLPWWRRQKILFRVDGAGFSHELLTWIASAGGGSSPTFRWEYSIGWSFTECEQAAIETVDRLGLCSRPPEKRPGVAAQGKAPRAGRRLALPQLRTSVSLLADAGPSRRAKLPGISRHRAEQSLAGALIAQALMEACGARSVEICPWSTREGLLLERLGPPHITADRSRLAG
ncbi:hypothetical protein ACR6C2_04595 [Streptomyces sp. INA 01156]